MCTCVCSCCVLGLKGLVKSSFGCIYRLVCNTIDHYQRFSARALKCNMKLRIAQRVCAKCSRLMALLGGLCRVLGDGWATKREKERTSSGLHQTSARERAKSVIYFLGHLTPVGFGFSCSSVCVKNALAHCEKER